MKYSYQLQEINDQSTSRYFTDFIYLKSLEDKLHFKDKALIQGHEYLHKYLIKESFFSSLSFTCKNILVSISNILPNEDLTQIY